MGLELTEIGHGAGADRGRSWGLGYVVFTTVVNMFFAFDSYFFLLGRYMW